MIPSTRLKKIVGVSIGSVMWRKRAQLPAPSTLAASYSSSETPCSPARKMTMRVPPTLAQSESSTGTNVKATYPSSHGPMYRYASTTCRRRARLIGVSPSAGSLLGWLVEHLLHRLVQLLHAVLEADLAQEGLGPALVDGLLE